ncbi:hypothetical protein F5146DRAFT_1001633 [Armillaria mellea]|nr:hypothetical protein F5146DRAFT_1001633 [Armillaria mellea]
MQHFDRILILWVLQWLFSWLKEHTVDIDGNHHYAITGNLMKLTINLDDVYPMPSFNALGDFIVEMLAACWNDYNKHAFRMLILNEITDSGRGRRDWFNPRDIFKFTADHISRLKGWKEENLIVNLKIHDMGRTIDVTDIPRMVYSYRHMY